jgi:hypothetical protein
MTPEELARQKIDEILTAAGVAEAKRAGTTLSGVS